MIYFQSGSNPATYYQIQSILDDNAVIFRWSQFVIHQVVDLAVNRDLWSHVGTVDKPFNVLQNENVASFRICWLGIERAAWRNKKKKHKSTESGILFL